VCGYGAFVWCLGPHAVHAAVGPFSEEMIARTIGQCCLTHELGEDFEVIAIHAQGVDQSRRVRVAPAGDT